MPSPDKLVVTHRAALQNKYGQAGYRRLQTRLTALVAADKARGLRTVVLHVDDQRAAKSLGVAKVTDPADCAGIKAVLDAAWAAYSPHYAVLLGAPDIIGQFALHNPAPDDDADVPSDLPYSCDSGTGADPGQYVGPTRVVSRLPDLLTARDPSYLVRLLRTATGWTSRPAADHLPVFAVSAAIWSRSTAASLLQLDSGAGPAHLSPGEGPVWPADQVGRLLHFINCHGDVADPAWYGEGPAGDQPVALQGARLTGVVTAGTVVAAECCFAALHYDPARSGGQPGILARYLREGAYGGFGSSTLAYGDAVRTTSADLLTRYFLSAVLEGASLGRAALQARQRFIADAGELDPYDLKTLVQFDLLADGSIHPVEGTAADSGGPTPKAFRGGAEPGLALPPMRESRRVALASVGQALRASVPRVRSRPSAELDPRQLARTVGISGAPHPSSRGVTYEVRDGRGRATGVSYDVLSSRDDRGRFTARVVRRGQQQPTTVRTLVSK